MLEKPFKKGFYGKLLKNSLNFCSGENCGKLLQLHHTGHQWLGCASGCHVGGQEFNSSWTNTQGLKIIEEKVLPLYKCNYTCKWLDFHVFSDNGCKPEVLSHSPCWKSNSMRH